jgi:PTS system N-acetylglucosamine-specific IIC component
VPERVSEAREGARGASYLQALGGSGNLHSIDACTTRLRLVIGDRTRVDTQALRALGASGTIQLTDTALQVIVGPIADQLAGEIRAAAGALARTASARAASVHPPVTLRERPEAREYLAALGGRGNIASVDPALNRLLLRVNDEQRIDETALRSLGVRAVARPGAHQIHLLLAEESESLAAALRALLS